MTPGSRRRSHRFRAAVAIFLVLAVGCGLPRDPKRTLDRVRGGTMRVGVVHHPPWVDLRAAGVPRGWEVELVGRLAEELGARIEWTVGGETVLMHELERHRLDLVIGGITRATAWDGKVGLTRPHSREGEHEFVLACPPGENGWLLYLDRWIDRQGMPREGQP